MEPTSPATFDDTQGRSYAPALDFVKLREILKRTQLDFGQIENFGQTWAYILSDDAKALAVLWVSISDRAGGVTEDDWLAAMDGESLEAGVDALLEAVKSFTRPLKRGMIEAGAGKIHQRYREAIQKATQVIERITDETTTEAIARLGTQQQSAQESSATLTTAGH